MIPTVLEVLELAQHLAEYPSVELQAVREPSQFGLERTPADDDDPNLVAMIRAGDRVQETIDSLRRYEPADELTTFPRRLNPAPAPPPRSP